ncbi:MAG: hypothetical protein H7231_09325 [Rhodoferax sp.]|nr:hypothetical protein [Actinomycetota bacterium]
MGAGPALAGAAGLAARGCARLLAQRPPGGADRWARTNHRGEPVTLLEGPALAAGALAALALPAGPGRARAGAALAVAGAAALGAYDDLAGDAGSKGLSGHLAALRRGQVTTGSVKVVGLALTGLAAAGLARPGDPGRGRAARLLDLLVGGVVVAGTANLVNLLDLRPGRALKTVLLLTAPLSASAGWPLAAVAGGAAAGLLRDDLAEVSMLGDTGANAAGALLGVAAVVGTGPRGRWATVAALVALTLASERVSFTAVIDRTPGLRELDRLGRRPARPAP